MGGKLPRVLADARNAIRAMVENGSTVLVACSGGADSLALAASAAFLNRKGEIRAGAVVVDHRMQPGSAEVASAAAAQCRALGLNPVLVLEVDVADSSEQAARIARYGALEIALERTGATHILLGHTLDDQAEQVMLGLARGSGTLSLAGMPAARGPFLRPLLGMDRSAMEQICAHEQLHYWEDPTNTDPTYLRNDIRHRLMPVLREVLGEQVSQALARTAALARADAAYLDEQAAAALLEATRVSTEHERHLDLSVLRALPGPLRSRVLRQGISGLGAPSPNFERLSALDHLVRDSKSAGPIQLDGQVLAIRVAGPRLAAGESAFLRLCRPPVGSDI